MNLLEPARATAVRLVMSPNGALTDDALEILTGGDAEQLIRLLCKAINVNRVSEWPFA